MKIEFMDNSVEMIGTPDMVNNLCELGIEFFRHANALPEDERRAWSAMLRGQLSVATQVFVLAPAGTTEADE